MIGAVLQTTRVVADPLVWEVLPIVLGIAAGLGRFISYAYTSHIEWRRTDIAIP